MGKNDLLTKADGAAKSHITKLSKQKTRFKQNKKRQNSNPPSQSRSKPEQATPWLKLKEAFLQQEEELKLQKEFECKEKDLFLQERNKRYNKFLMKEKQKEETVWEEFTGDCNDEDHVIKEGKDEHSEKIELVPDCNGERSESFLNNPFRKSAVHAEENIYNSDVKGKRTQHFQNNNSTMSSKAKNFYRKVITKTTCAAQGTSFYQEMQDLKLRGVKASNKFN